MDMEQWAKFAEEQIDAHEQAGKSHALFAAEEIEMEAERSALKSRLAAALLGTPNAATGRNHSAESAKDAAAVSEEYLAHESRRSQTVLRKNAAQTEKYSARLRAELAIACVKAEAGVS